MLNGSIPACLGEIESLRHLFLDSNNLSSTIPHTLGDLRDLLSLNLSTNLLSGSLPWEIGNLSVVTEIDLSWNRLSGVIPSTIGSSLSLVSLSLAHNELQGTIPQALSNLVSLEVLNLSRNNLSGEIPKSLESLRYLRSLDVSFNRLRGEIPSQGNFGNFTAHSFTNNDALCGASRLGVPPCRIRREKSKRMDLLKYIFPPIGATILLLALVLGLIIRLQKRKQKPAIDSNSLHMPWIRVSYYELQRATDTFSESNLLGTGSFGSVYKGTLSNGTIIAAKVFNVQQERSLKSFEIECRLLYSIRHRNLIRIISSCANLDFKALILEYMPNGNLEGWLYSHEHSLDIVQRLNIMMDVALALEYLHHGHGLPIVHCDLKPNNVLLDEDMVAHVGDFSVSKLLGEGETMAQTITLATIGYMAPEYGMEGRISTRGDMYSYGVMLMETLTGKKPTNEMFAGDMSLRSWLEESLQHGSILDVVDNDLIKNDDANFFAKEQCLSSILILGMECSNTLPEERPDIKDVVIRVQKIRTIFTMAML